jgi:hypothetical protein
METIHTVEPAYHPKNKMGFLIDWLLTLKCNYDCAYCGIGPRGHDNSTQHPPIEKCVAMLKQMYQYTDVMMQNKKIQFKDAILNVYGGEALYHPNIEEIIYFEDEVRINLDQEFVDEYETNIKKAEAIEGEFLTRIRNIILKNNPLIRSITYTNTNRYSGNAYDVRFKYRLNPRVFKEKLVIKTDGGE